MFMSKSKKGFTLAEVLITLLIIGVVASLVIPGLIGDTQQAEFKVAVKKALAVTNQALNMSISQDSTDAQNPDTAANLMNQFANKLNILDNNGVDTITTADGMIYKFFTTVATGATCDLTSASPATAVDDIGTAKCYVLVDVNGLKKPNVLSAGGLFKDQYYLIIRSKSVIPARTSTTAGDDMALQAMYK